LYNKLQDHSSHCTCAALCMQKVLQHDRSRSALAAVPNTGCRDHPVVSVTRVPARCTGLKCVPESFNLASPLSEEQRIAFGPLQAVPGDPDLWVVSDVDARLEGKVTENIILTFGIQQVHSAHVVRFACCSSAKHPWAANMVWPCHQRHRTAETRWVLACSSAELETHMLLCLLEVCVKLGVQVIQSLTLVRMWVPLRAWRHVWWVLLGV
jgi:hypothetical protein